MDWSVLCLQIYIETNDYVLRNDDKLGVTMYTNRPLQKDEPFFVAPVGPIHTNKQLLYADADADATLKINQPTTTESDNHSERNAMTTVLVLDQHEDSDWKELPEWIQQAASVLGYTKKLWNKDKEPKTCDKDWQDLRVDEQQAATRLGYTATLWDANVDVDANENGNGKSSKDRNTMSIERREFMDRYLLWQDKYYNNDNQKVLAAAGASDSVFTKLTTVDFQRVPTPEDDDEDLDEDEDDDDEDTVLLPTAMDPSYNFNLQASDYVIVEFIPNPTATATTAMTQSSSSIPDRRRFEVLPFDEAICWDGEPNYNPWTMSKKRPPTFDNEVRDLDIPGHFSNHACGNSAAMYDTFRLPTSEDDEENENENDTESWLSSVVVAPGQPKEMQLQIKDYCTTKVWPTTVSGDDLPNVMTSHRALPTNTEVTTDYILWHWSNDDYNDSNNQEEDIMEPWFHCLCRDAHCHSRDGFRGVKYLTLKEQQRLYRVCSNRIQNHIDWKVYQLEKDPSKKQQQK